MKIHLFILLTVCLVLVSCAQEEPKTFSESALNSISFDLEGNEIPFKSILEKYKGKKIFIDVWASWCHDCVGSIPKVKELQDKLDDSKVQFVYLSVDKEQPKWKAAIEKYELKGEHYYQKQGWESDFNKSIKLDWIPRYMVIDENGDILLFKSIEADEEKLYNALK